jgi:hypothetical protein
MVENDLRKAVSDDVLTGFLSAGESEKLRSFGCGCNQHC